MVIRHFLKKVMSTNKTEVLNLLKPVIFKHLLN